MCGSGLLPASTCEYSVLCVTWGLARLGLSVCLSVRWSVCLSVGRSVCLCARVFSCAQTRDGSDPCCELWVNLITSHSLICQAAQQVGSIFAAMPVMPLPQPEAERRFGIESWDLACQAEHYVIHSDASTPSVGKGSANRRKRERVREGGGRGGKRASCLGGGSPRRCGGAEARWRGAMQSYSWGHGSWVMEAVPKNLLTQLRKSPLPERVAQTRCSGSALAALCRRRRSLGVADGQGAALVSHGLKTDAATWRVRDNPRATTRSAEIRSFLILLHSGDRPF